MLKLLSRAASSAVKVVGSNDPAAGFASDFLGEVLGEELRGAQAKAPSQNPGQIANGAGDKPSSDWVRNLGPSEVDAQGLGLRPGPAGQGLQISGDALSNWSNEIDGGIALNGSMAPGAQAITEAVVGQGQGPLAALAAAGLDRQQQIAAYGQLVASGQVQLNAQGIPIVQPGQVLQFDLSDMSAAQLGGQAIAQESAGRAQREALEELAAQQAAETYAGGAGGGRGFVNPALAGSLAGTAQDNGLFSRDSMSAYWSGDDILSRGMRAAGNTIYDVAEALTPADSTQQEVQRARELGQLRQSFNAAREAGDIGEMQKLQARHAQITSADGNPSMLQVAMASDILRAQIAQGLPADRYSLGLAAGAAITQGFAGMVAPTAGGPIAGVNGVGTAKPLFGNIYPEHVIDPAKMVPNERLRGISGNFNYVITEQGTLIVGRSGHTSLTGGAPVQAAGELQLCNGNVKWIDNASGHYQPSSNIGSVAETAFNNAGLDATGKFVPKVWVPNPTLPRGGSWVKTN